LLRVIPLSTETFEESHRNIAKVLKDITISFKSERY
jgi:hypothetical protein